MRESQPLFEICEKRPSHWGPLNSDIDLQNTNLFTGIKVHLSINPRLFFYVEQSPLRHLAKTKNICGNGL